MSETIDYKKLAFKHYQHYCVYCGFATAEILQAAYVNHNRADNSVENLIVLCPTGKALGSNNAL